MTFYHDLKKQTYDGVRATPFTRIHDRSTWRVKERLIDECKKVALRYDVSFDWSGGYGILPEIIRAAQFAAVT